MHTDTIQPNEIERMIALEKSMQSQFEFIYITVWDNEKLIAILYYQYLKFKSKFFNSIFKKYEFCCWLERIIIDNRFKLLIAGNIFSINAPGLLYIDAQYTSLGSNILLEGLEIVKKKYSISMIVLKDLPKNLKPFFTSHQFNGYHDDFTMALDIKSEWNSIDDYIQSLKHKYAQRARKVLKLSSGIDIKTLTLDDIVQHKEIIQKLFSQVVDKQEIKLGIPDANYFIEMKKSLNEKFIFRGFYLDKKLIAFSSFILSEHECESHYIGFEYSINSEYQLYFRILFDTIQTAIQNECTILELGRTAREAKAIIGAKPVYFSNYLQITNPIARYIFKTLDRNFKQQSSQGWQNRHPFK